MPNRHGSDLPAGEDYDYGFGGMLKDNEIKGNSNSYDFGARMLDPRIGRWFATDALFAKFPDYSPYNYVTNNPINASDPDGNDVILIIWATNGQIGHAAIAVSNYKAVNRTIQVSQMVMNDPEKWANEGMYSFQMRSKVVTEMVPDGTYTYYDNWPSQSSNLSGVKGAMKTVDAYRSHDPGKKGIIIMDVSEFSSGNLTSQHPYVRTTGSGIPNEDHMQDGVLEIKTDFETDQKVKAQLEGLNNRSTHYNGMDFNCSTYASYGLYNVLGKVVGKESVKFGLQATTPNQLWHDTKNEADKQGLINNVIVDPGNKASQPYEEGLYNSATPSTPSTPPTTPKN